MSINIVEDGELKKISGGDIESISVNGANVPPDSNKNVNIVVPAYETGTWTPQAFNADGIIGDKVNKIYARYVRTGKLVYIVCSLYYNAGSGDASSFEIAEIKGLPFFGESGHGSAVVGIANHFLDGISIYTRTGSNKIVFSTPYTFVAHRTLALSMTYACA